MAESMYIISLRLKMIMNAGMLQGLAAVKCSLIFLEVLARSYIMSSPLSLLVDVFDIMQALLHDKKIFI